MGSKTVQIYGVIFLNAIFMITQEEIHAALSPIEYLHAENKG